MTQSEDAKTYDVFISYSHTDDQPEPGQEHGFVKVFGDALEVYLAKKRGRAKVWHDHDLKKAQAFDRVIAQAIDASGILLVLISASYLRSVTDGYCKKELEHFHGKVENEPTGLRAGDYERVFLVLLDDIPYQDWPDFGIEATTGHVFHSDGFALEINTPEFRKAMRSLADELAEAIDALEKAGRRAAEPAGTDAASGATSEAPAADDADVFRVFLANAGDDVGATKRQIARGLTAHADAKIEVLTNVPPPYELEPHADEVRAALDAADLAVHVLGASPGESIDEQGEERTYPVEQCRLAGEHDTPQLVLTPSEFDVSLLEDKSAYREFIEGLEQTDRGDGRFELAHVDRNRMVDEILAKRERILEARRRRSSEAQNADGASGGGTAFVDLHINDIAHAPPLLDCLQQRKVAWLMSQSDDPSVFEDNLRRACLHLVVFGGVAREWVINRLMEANKLILLNELPTKIAVYVAPPGKEPREIQFPVETAINCDAFDPATLEPILARAMEGDA